ncbi:MAG: DUF6962 family protein [Bacteroidia bacterium]
MIKYVVELDWSGIILRDPVTALTNVMMFAAGIYGWKKIRPADKTNFYAHNWGNFFLFLAISSLIGVIVHGFSYYTSEKTHLGVWMAMVIVQGLGSTYAQRAEAQRYIHKRYRFLHLFPALQVLLFILAMIYWKNYNVVKIHIALGLLPIMLWNIILGFRSHTGTALIGWGIFMAAITAAIHTFKISIHPIWLNYNDISHLLIVVSFLMMAKGLQKVIAS